MAGVNNITCNTGSQIEIHDGDFGKISVVFGSHLSMSGGCVFTTIDLEGDSPSASFSGGQFDWLYCGGPGWQVDFWGYGFNWEVGDTPRQRVLTGCWADGEFFRTTIYQEYGYEGAIVSHEIPEPGSLLLLGVGLLLVLTKKEARA